MKPASNMPATVIASEAMSRLSLSGKTAIALMVVNPPAKPVDQKMRRGSGLNQV